MLVVWRGSLSDVHLQNFGNIFFILKGVLLRNVFHEHQIYQTFTIIFDFHLFCIGIDLDSEVNVKRETMLFVPIDIA